MKAMNTKPLDMELMTGVKRTKTFRDELNELSNEEFAEWIFKNIIKQSWLGTDYWIEKFSEKVISSKENEPQKTILKCTKGDCEYEGKEGLCCFSCDKYGLECMCSRLEEVQTEIGCFKDVINICESVYIEK